MLEGVYNRLCRCFMRLSEDMNRKVMLVYLCIYRLKVPCTRPPTLAQYVLSAIEPSLSMIGQPKHRGNVDGADMLDAITFCTLHLLYDSMPLPDFLQHAGICGYWLGVGAGEVASQMFWLQNTRHCRYTWLRSDATKRVQILMDDLPTHRQRLLFLVLVLCGCNSRECYTEFALIAYRTPSREWDRRWLHAEICRVLGRRGWLADSRRYPVSAATAYRTNICECRGDEHKMHDRVAELVIAIFVELDSLDSYEDLKYVSTLSILQQAMLARYLNLSYTEEWTYYSGQFVPPGESPASLGILMRAHLEGVKELWALIHRVVPLDERYHLFSSSHMEHCMCEYRKYRVAMSAS